MMSQCFDFEYFQSGLAWNKTKRLAISISAERILGSGVWNSKNPPQKYFPRCAKASGHLINHKNWTDKLGSQSDLYKIVSDATESSKLPGSRSSFACRWIILKRRFHVFIARNATLLVQSVKKPDSSCNPYFCRDTCASAGSVWTCSTTTSWRSSSGTSRTSTASRWALSETWRNSTTRRNPTSPRSGPAF